MSLHRRRPRIVAQGADKKRVMAYIVMAAEELSRASASPHATDGAFSETSWSVPTAERRRAHRRIGIGIGQEERMHEGLLCQSALQRPLRTRLETAIRLSKCRNAVGKKGSTGSNPSGNELVTHGRIPMSVSTHHISYPHECQHASHLVPHASAVCNRCCLAAERAPQAPVQYGPAV